MKVDWLVIFCGTAMDDFLTLSVLCFSEKVREPVVIQSFSVGSIQFHPFQINTPAWAFIVTFYYVIFITSMSSNTATLTIPDIISLKQLQLHTKHDRIYSHTRHIFRIILKYTRIQVKLKMRTYQNCSVYISYFSTKQ